MKIIFASNNENKAGEIRHALAHGVEIVTLKEAGITIDIPEPYETLEENAREKSTVIHQLTGMNCFSEDTGLEVDALHGAPGVRSARYAGSGKSFEKNMDKLLKEMADKTDRAARFRTIISLILDGHETLFEGTCEGHISRERRGNSGFGYDPIFIPLGSEKTFGEMSLAEKQRFSHRARAVEKLVIFLNSWVSEPEAK